MAKNNRRRSRKFAYQTGPKGSKKLLIQEMDKILANPRRKARIKKVDKLLKPYHSL